MRCLFHSTPTLFVVLLGCRFPVSHAQNTFPGRRLITRLDLTDLAAFRPAIAQDKSDTALSLSSSGAVTASDGKATLPDGVTVELLGVTDGKTGTQPKEARWWKTDGTLLASPPYAPTFMEKFYHGKPNRLDANLTFSLKVAGIPDGEASFTRTFTPHAIVTGGEVNPFVPSANTYILYEVDARFTDKLATSSLRFKIAHSPWQTVATAAVLPTIVHTPDGSIVRFGKPDKEDARPKKFEDSKFSEIAVIVKSANDQPITDVARRVALIDDQGKSVLLDNPISLTYDRQQNGKEELHLLIAVPTKLRGHIRQYQLQTRPYQYVDFPNISLKPKM